MGGSPSKVLPGLFLGGCDVVDGDHEWFSENNITHCVSICHTTPPDSVIPATNKIFLEEPDNPGAVLAVHFDRVVNFVHAARVGGGTVYIHCAAGISRSTTMTLAYLMTATGLPWRRLLRFVASRRSCVCPNQGFQAQLQQYQDGACSNATKKLHEKYPEGASLVQEIIKEIEQFEEEVQGRMAGEGGGTQVEEEEESHPPTGLFETRAQLSSEAYVPPHRRRPPPGGDDGTLGDDGPLLPAPGQGVGAALLQDGRRALRAGFAREGDFALEQEEKVRAQLRPLKAAGAQAGGHMGLEWLDK
ncbi:unnamed protein product, partial [Heterosigma akashiwo]